jgi:hypothetical protein
LQGPPALNGRSVAFILGNPAVHGQRPLGLLGDLSIIQFGHWLLAL